MSELKASFDSISANRGDRENKQIIVSIGDDGANAVHFNGDLWFSQQSLAKIFKTSTQNINIHLANLANCIDERFCVRYFALEQSEGKRIVRRKLRHFNFEIAHMIGIRSQRFSELNTLIVLAGRHGIKKACYKVIPIQERTFEETLLTVLKGITDVLQQHRVLGFRIDFYLPEYGMAIEYDEAHHSKAGQRVRDRERQNAIAEFRNVKFIRVQSGKELEGLNRILSHIFSHKRLGSQSESRGSNP